MWENENFTDVFRRFLENYQKESRYNLYPQFDKDLKAILQFIGQEDLFLEQIYEEVTGINPWEEN